MRLSRKRSDWLSKWVTLLVLVAGIGVPLSASADRSSARSPGPELSNVSRDASLVRTESKEKHERWIAPKRTILRFNEDVINAPRPRPGLEYSELVRDRGPLSPHRSLIRLRQNFDDQIFDSVSKLKPAG